VKEARRKRGVLQVQLTAQSARRQDPLRSSENHARIDANLSRGVRDITQGETDMGDKGKKDKGKKEQQKKAQLNPKEKRKLKKEKKK
jgi:hypothetical protein